MTLEHEPTVCQVPYAQPTAPICVVWSWGFNKGVLCTCLGSKGQTTYKRLLVLFLPVSYATCVCLCGLIRQKHLSMATTTWVRSPLGSCLGDMAVRTCMPDRGLVFECVTSFDCAKRVTFLVDCVKCVSIPIIKTG